jgi:hypothetical protein
MAHHTHKGFNPEMAEEERHRMIPDERAALKKAHDVRDKAQKLKKMKTSLSQNRKESVCCQ